MIGALQVAAALNALTLILPIVGVVLASVELRTHGRLVQLLACVTGIFLLPAFDLRFQTADHSSVAFGMLSCWYLARNEKSGNGGVSTAAGLCLLAIW
ncbi:MAG: hypothetical protein ABIY47_09090 [Opitutaceae bacterium]